MSIILKQTPGKAFFAMYYFIRTEQNDIVGAELNSTLSITTVIKAIVRTPLNNLLRGF